MRRALIGVAKLIGAILLVAVLVLAVCGVPSPQSATVSGVPRVSWGGALSVVSGVAKLLDRTSFAAWDPSGGMVVHALAGSGPVPHRLDAPGAAPVALPLPTRTGAIRFNPDPAKRYAVYARDEGGDENYQLYRWAPESDAHTRLTDGESRNALGPFSRDGTQLAFTSTRRNGTDRDIYVVDPRDPDTQRLVLEVEGSFSVADWSPSGDRLLVSRYLSIAESRPYVLDLATAQLEPVLPLDPPSGYSELTWSAEPDTVFLVTDRDHEFRQLVRVELRTKAMASLGEPTGWDVVSVEPSRDRSRLAILVNEDGYRRPYLVDTATGSRTRLTLPEGSLSGLVFHPTKPQLGFTLTPPGGIPGVYALDLETNTVVTWSQPAETHDAALPRPRLVRYTSSHAAGGSTPRRIPAFVFDPPEDAPTPAPVLIRIHGGPEGQSRAASNAVYDAARRQLGVAIVAPNVRGSSGYGKSYAALDNGRLREDSVRDIGALLDWIAAQPQYDAGRVIVYGGSYGGYMVLASMVHYPDRIRCGIDTVGISNFVTFLENTKPYRRDLRRAEYGDERDPQMREFLESISPSNHAEKIAGALMIVQGANDPRVPVTESRQMVQRLRELGREVWYIEFDNEGHGVRMPLNVAYNAAVGFAFAQQCLEG